MTKKRVKTKKERAVDLVKDFLQWIVVTAAAFVWWLAMLLLISIFLLNVWIVTFETILKISVGLTVVTSVIYLGVLLYRRLK